MKNIIVYTRDFSGCSHVRLRWPFNHIIANSEKYNINVIFSVQPIFDENILANTRTIICQRFVTPIDRDIIKRYKALQPKFGYKLVFELDDICFGNFVPSYNSSSLFRSEQMIKEIDDILLETLPYYDNIVVSTDFLKKMLSERYNVWNVQVQPNLVSKSMWDRNRKENEKPVILYSGAPQHYKNPSILQNGQRIIQEKGDWTDAWIQFILEGVKNDKFKFVCMAQIPYFLEPIIEKIEYIPWNSCDLYVNTVKNVNADISIAPLQENIFNKCKSDLRFLEACAGDMLFMGTVFPDGPYRELTFGRIYENSTFEDINAVYEELIKNKAIILKNQKEFIIHNNRYIEDGINNYMNSYLIRE